MDVLGVLAIVILFLVILVKVITFISEKILPREDVVVEVPQADTTQVAAKFEDIWGNTFISLMVLVRFKFISHSSIML